MNSTEFLKLISEKAAQGVPNARMMQDIILERDRLSAAVSCQQGVIDAQAKIIQRLENEARERIPSFDDLVDPPRSTSDALAAAMRFDPLPGPYGRRR